MNRAQIIIERKLANFIDKKYKSKKMPKKVLQENIVREKIRKLLLEADKQINSYQATGINVLANLLRNILPVIESDYKMLTTNVEQRKSYAVHLIENTKLAIEASLSNFDAFDNDNDTLGEGTADEQNKKSSFFININPDEKEKNKKEFDKKRKEVSNDTYKKITSEEETGYKVSLETFKRIKVQILDAYAILSDSRDKEIFYDFIVINLKKHFNLFENKISGEILFPEVEDERKPEQEVEYRSV